jgi:tetratricopeptide (TPR) repeat protein
MLTVANSIWAKFVLKYMLPTAFLVFLLQTVTFAYADDMEICKGEDSVTEQLENEGNLSEAGERQAAACSSILNSSEPDNNGLYEFDAREAYWYQGRAYARLAFASQSELLECPLLPRQRKPLTITYFELAESNYRLYLFQIDKWQSHELSDSNTDESYRVKVITLKKEIVAMASQYLSVVYKCLGRYEDALRTIESALAIATDSSEIARLNIYKNAYLKEINASK